MNSLFVKDTTELFALSLQYFKRTPYVVQPTSDCYTVGHRNNQQNMLQLARNLSICTICKMGYAISKLSRMRNLQICDLYLTRTLTVMQANPNPKFLPVARSHSAFACCADSQIVRKNVPKTALQSQCHNITICKSVHHDLPLIQASQALLCCEILRQLPAYFVPFL